MTLNRRYTCGCIPPVPLLVEKYGNEDSGLCESCGYIYDERLYVMRLRQHWSDPDNPIPEGTEDLDTILRAIDPNYRAALEVS